MFSQEIITGIEDGQLPNFKDELDISVMSVVGQASIEARKARKQSLLKRKRLVSRFQIKFHIFFFFFSFLSFFLNIIKQLKDDLIFFKLIYFMDTL